MITTDQARQETVNHLGDLLRIDTTNPPGNETAACRFIGAILEREDIPYTILEGRPGRGNLVARLTGTGREPPLLLMAHLDVVPVEADAWTVPPFKGQIKDGYLYGRGSLDTKQLVAMELEIMLLLRRKGLPLERDVIWMVNADEETGGSWGAGWMVREHPDLIRAPVALNEGGGFSLRISGRRFYPVQTGEKGTARFTLKAVGHPGHGSQPHNDNAIVKLAEALQRLAAMPFPMHLSPTVRSFIVQVASALEGPERERWHNLLDSRQAQDALQRLPADDGIRAMMHAMLHNTATPTIVHAGSKVNVIPSMAEAQVDARIVPGQTERDFVRELRQAIPPEIEITFGNTRMGLESQANSPLFETIKRVMAAHDPGARVVPFLSAGATDARHLTKLGTQVYGFCPMRGSAAELERVHGHDERISLENVAFGVEVLYQVVRDYVGQSEGSRALP